MLPFAISFHLHTNVSSGMTSQCPRSSIASGAIAPSRTYSEPCPDASMRSDQQARIEQVTRHRSWSRKPQQDFRRKTMRDRREERQEERATFGRGGDATHYQMRQKLVSIGDDFWIENDHGERAYKVDGKALRMRQTLIFEDPQGHEL